MIEGNLKLGDSLYLLDDCHDSASMLAEDLVLLQVGPGHVPELLEGDLRLRVRVEQVQEGQDADLVDLVLQYGPAGLDDWNRKCKDTRFF